MRSIIKIDFIAGGRKNGEQKRLGFIFLNILITTAPITMMLTAIKRGKDWVFLEIGVKIYKMELRFYRKV